MLCGKRTVLRFPPGGRRHTRRRLPFARRDSELDADRRGLPCHSYVSSGTDANGSSCGMSSLQ